MSVRWRNGMKSRALWSRVTLRALQLGALGLSSSALGWAVACSAVPDNSQVPDDGATGDGASDAGSGPTIGTTTMASTVCQADGQAGAECYVVTVSCAGVADADVIVKYRPGDGDTSDATGGAGTIIFMTGGGGTEYYEDSFTYGPNLIEDLIGAGFATVQVKWDISWITGPGGFERLACRPATITQWIYDELHGGGDAEPFCATGNSGGSAQIAYALTRYGLAAVYDTVVPSSGPPSGRVDLGCGDCNPDLDVVDVPCANDSLCYLPGRINTIDGAYAGSPCRDGEFEVLMADSVVTDGADLHYPSTKVIAVFGELDGTNAVAQGMQWYDAITSEVEIICAPDTTHSVASAVPGYEILRDELIAECKLRP